MSVYIDLNRVLENSSMELFKLNLSLQMPKFFSQKFFKKNRQAHLFSQLENKVYGLDERTRQEILTELLDIYLPFRRRAGDTGELQYEVQEAKFLNNEFKEWISRVKSLSESERNKVYIEAVGSLNSEVVKLRYRLLESDVKKKDMEKYILVNEALHILFSIGDDFKRKIHSRKRDYRYLNKLIVSMLTLLLSIEALRRGEYSKENLSRLMSKVINFLDETDFTPGKNKLDNVVKALS
jgi:hypothetical protein